jgi:hypothetical protein
MPQDDVKLQPGIGFRLQPDGSWKPEKIPSDVLRDAKFSGYLTIDGYRSTVFETPDKNQWAQKSTNTAAEPTTASKIADTWLQGHGVRFPKTDSMHALVKTRVSLASRIASRWLRTASTLREVVQRWTSNPPDLGDNDTLDGVAIDDTYYMYVEDARSVDGATGQESGTVWQVIRYTTTGDDYVVYSAEPGSFDIAQAEKAINEDASKNASLASQIAARWLRGEDITSLVEKKLDRGGGDDEKYDKAIVDFVTKARKRIEPIDAALSKACDVLLQTRDKIEHKHPRVQDHYVQKFLQELAQKHRELEDMRNQLVRGLNVQLDGYESEANSVGDFHPVASRLACTTEEIVGYLSDSVHEWAWDAAKAISDSKMQPEEAIQYLMDLPYEKAWEMANELKSQD